MLDVTFGIRLRKIREALDVGFRELSRLSGVDQTQIWRIEKDQVSPKLETVERLAQGLGIEVHVLFGGKMGDDVDSERLLAQYRRLNPNAKQAVLRYVADVERLFLPADEARQLPLMEVA